MEPIIVTAFWDVGRGKSTIIPRTNEKYYNEFREWARIKNVLVVFCSDKRTESEVYEIRKKYGLEGRTKIIITDNIFSIEEELYKKMVKVEGEQHYNPFKYYQNAMSDVAKFDYAWLMKYWCIKEAAKIFEESLLAWMDFGFNHIDVCYTNMREFDFLWKCNYTLPKIRLFALRDPQKVSIIDSLQLRMDTFMGVFHIVPSNLAKEFWLEVKKAMEVLLYMGCLDDDQQLLLMAYKNRPELFDVQISDWFLPLKENGGFELTTRERKKESAYRRYFATKDNIRDFTKLSKQRAIRYYRDSDN